MTYVRPTATTRYRRFLILLALVSGSSISTAMVLVRVAYSGRVTYIFLLWNLFLAWIPLLWATLAYVWRRRPLAAGTAGALWLLFFPNALYLVTDLIHLRPSGHVPLWYDLILLLSFALTGLWLGFQSLYIMQLLVTRWLGILSGWIFVLLTMPLSSLGVYIGRFLRWNSWDVLVNPLSLSADLFTTLANTRLMLKSATVSGLLTAVFLVAYVILILSPNLPNVTGAGVEGSP